MRQCMFSSSFFFNSYDVVPISSPSLIYQPSAIDEAERFLQEIMPSG